MENLKGIAVVELLNRYFKMIKNASNVTELFQSGLIRIGNERNKRIKQVNQYDKVIHFTKKSIKNTKGK